MKWTYCLYCYSTAGLLPPRLPVFKIGITDHVPTRIRQIESELSYSTGRSVKVRKAVAMPLIFASLVERKLHGVFARIRAKMPRHSGHTEWFSILNYGAAVIYLALLAVFNCQMTGGRVVIMVVVFFAPLPLDGMVLVVASAVAEYVVFLFSIYCFIAGLGWLAQQM